MRKLFLVMFVALSFLVVGCSDSSKPDKLSFEEQDVIEKYPVSENTKTNFAMYYDPYDNNRDPYELTGRIINKSGKSFKLMQATLIYFDKDNKMLFKVILEKEHVSEKEDWDFVIPSGGTSVRLFQIVEIKGII